MPIGEHDNMAPIPTPPPVERWEYNLVQGSGDNLLHNMDMMGRLGWECINVVMGNLVWTAFFKRRLP